MMAKRQVEVEMGWNFKEVVLTHAVVLERHVSGFPRVLVGRKTLFADFQGVRLKWEEGGVSVCFGRWPDRKGRCSGTEKGQESVCNLLNNLGDVLTVAEELLSKKFRSPEKGEEALQEQSESFRRQER